MRKIAFYISAASLLTLVGCETYTPARYSMVADTNVALKALGVGSINVGSFSMPEKFDQQCRGAGPIAPPDNLTFAGYIQKALVDELKIAGLYDDKAPKVTLTGALKSLSFSSAVGLTGGRWDIALDLKSSNAKSMSTSDSYSFESGFIATTACKQTAEAYGRSVQNLIGKIVKDPQFKTLLQ